MNSARNQMTRTAWGLASFKAGYFASLVAALLLWGSLGEFIRLPQKWTPMGGPAFASHFTGWDAGYYLYLSQHGYEAGDRACAFNPLWPFLIKWSSVLTEGEPLVAGMVLANLFSLAGCLLFWRVAGERFGPAAATLALLFLLAFPGSLFFQFVYSEPVFFFLLMLLWWGLERRHYTVAAGAAFLLPLARSLGVFAVLPIGWHALEPAIPRLRERMGRGLAALGAGRLSARFKAAGHCEPSEGGDNAHGCVGAGGRFPLRSVAGRARLVALPVAGWGAYLALMGLWTGNPFEGLEAQKYWGVHSIWNLVNVPKFVVGLVTPTAWHAFRGSLLDRCVFVLVLYVLPVIWRLGKDMMAWTLMLAIVPAMSGTFTSFTRFASCAFPVFIGLGVFFAMPRRRVPQYALLAVFIILHGVLVWRYVNCRWAG